MAKFKIGDKATLFGKYFGTIVAVDPDATKPYCFEYNATKHFEWAFEEHLKHPQLVYAVCTNQDEVIAVRLSKQQAQYAKAEYFGDKIKAFYLLPVYNIPINR